VARIEVQPLFLEPPDRLDDEDERDEDEDDREEEDEWYDEPPLLEEPIERPDEPLGRGE